MKTLLGIGVRGLLVLAAFFLLYLAVGMGYVAYDLNAQRIDLAHKAESPAAVLHSEDGAVIGGHDGPTAMWMTIGGKTIPIEPKASHIAAHGAISLLAFGGAVALLRLAVGKWKK